MKKTVFIVNPVSGTKSKQAIVNLIPDFFEAENCHIAYTQHAGHAEELAKEAAEGGAEMVVAVGGDGTVNEVARAIVHTETALGIIPCGSGNGLARHLGISMNPKKALKTLREGNVQTCDYGRINGRPFFCTAGIGFDAEVSDTFAHAGKRGLPTYLKTTIAVGWKYHGEVMDLEFDDGETIRGERFWLVTAGNAAQYGNDFFITPDASLRDGLLDVNLWSPFNKITSPIIGIRMHGRTIDHDKNVRIKRCKRVCIHREKEGAIHIDGDPCTEGKDIIIEIVPKGVKMLVGCPSKNLL